MFVLKIMLVNCVMFILAMPDIQDGARWRKIDILSWIKVV